MLGKRQTAKQNWHHLQRKFRIAKARIHNTQLSFTKLPEEVKRRIFRFVIATSFVERHDLLASRNAGVQEMKVLRVLDRMRRMKGRKRGPMDSIGSTGHGEWSTVGLDPHGKVASDAYLDALTGGKWSPDIKTKAVNLLLVDSEIFLPTLQAMLIRERPWTVTVGPNGVEFIGLPIIKHMHTMRTEFKDVWEAGFEVFGSSTGLFRLRDLRVLTIDLYSPEKGDREGLLRIVRNVQCLVDILQQRQALQDDKEPLMLLRIVLNNAESDRTPGTFVLHQVQVTENVHRGQVVRRATTRALRPRRSHILPCAWFDLVWDMENEEYFPTPATFLFQGTWVIDLITIPFRRLRNVSRVRLMLPPELEALPEVCTFREQFQSEVEGFSPIDQSREHKLQIIHDANDDMAYRRLIRLQQKSLGLANYPYGRVNFVPLNELYSSMNKIDVDVSFYLPNDNETDEHGRPNEVTGHFSQRWHKGFVNVNDLYVDGTRNNELKGRNRTR